MGGRGRKISEFKTSLFYRANFRIAELLRETLSQGKVKQKPAVDPFTSDETFMP